MRTKRITGLLTGVMLGLSTWAQLDWNLGGNLVSLGTDYVGCNASSTFPLHLRTIPQLSIDMSTQDIRRFRLLPDATYTIGSYPTQVRDGALLLSPDVDSFWGTGARPFSALHLAGVGVNWQQSTFRPWMRNGVTFTGNSDQGYLGQKCKLDGNGDEISDRTDMVAHWSGDPSGEYGPDRFRFLFTGGYNTAAYGWHSTEGLEAMRMTPIDSTHVNVGIGDFYAGNLVDPPNINEPTERLDVLNGKVRIRQLPADLTSTSAEYVTVNTTTGVLEHRPLPPAATANCEWFKDAATGHQYVLTGTGNWNPASTCPDRGWMYSIGESNPAVEAAKFRIYQNSNERNLQYGLFMNFVTKPGTPGSHGIKSTVGPTGAGNTAPNAYGVSSFVTDPSGNGWGTYGKVTSSTGTADLHGAYGFSERSGSSAGAVYGVYGRSDITASSTGSTSGFGGYLFSQVLSASGSVTESKGAYGVSKIYGTAQKSYGMYAWSDARPGSTITNESYGLFAQASGTGTVATSYGVKASASGGAVNYSIRATSPGIGAADWSGYFDGKVEITGNCYHAGVFQFSDASLKTDVQDLVQVNEVLEGLHPHRYRYTQQAQDRMGLSDGFQLGFVAQEVQEIAPELVSATTLAAVLDTAGQEIWPAHDVSAVNYVGMIPLLVAGYQQQQATIETLQNRLDEMQQALAACCANPGGNNMLQQPTGTIPAHGALDTASDRKLRIVPNPFSEPPTVYYTLDRAGRMQLIANSADGKELNVLHEATMQVGDYQYAWDTTNLAPGMYYVTLLMDGKPLVKKAVKVTR